MIKIKSIIIFLVIVIIGVGTYLLINYQTNYLEKIVKDNRSSWDIFSSSDTIMSGSYMGKIYERDYTIDTIPTNLLTVLMVDHYLANTSGFYEENNKINDTVYEQKISKNEFEDSIKKLLGKNHKINLTEIQYGCGRYLKLINNYYVIGSKDPDSCGLFNMNNSNNYISFISDYKKEKDTIVVTLLVGYLDVYINQSNKDDLKYVVYKDKTKDVILNNNYNPSCIFDNIDNPICTNNLSKYKVILKKEGFSKYYFYSISKA